jgi:hypothetical protein
MPSVDVCAIDSTASLDEGGGRALGGGVARGSGGDESKRQLQRDSSGSPGDIAYMPQILPGGSHTTPWVPAHSPSSLSAPGLNGNMLRVIECWK